ncbi:uncharacterized protein TNCV_3537001 [Trichonephila clavipes]|uniref:Uncharacterized protein n=1 Tax=Trichonephila clavipes TaxID=2585209 RepID=A0A8X6VWZ2_TRICX|nr:uncharacterized protein TNCV_3537001 [Trichonephila clavipes]
MSKSKELRAFDRGCIVGCHLCRKSVNEIADILQKTKSTVSGVIVKWKRQNNETVGRKYLEFQSSSGISVSSRRERELKNLGFHGRATTHKPQNAKNRFQWCRAHRHWTVWKTVLWRDESVLAIGWVFCRCPDLNPIEHLWDELERRLCSQPNRLSSLQALTSAVMDAWKAIPRVNYQKWVESLSKRVKTVIHTKGGP